jgi:hypothetical protein
MANRNFDASSIIQRLKDKNIAQGIYKAQQAGKPRISNPQTTDASPQVIASFKEGSETAYSRTLKNTTTVDTGASCN